VLYRTYEAIQSLFAKLGLYFAASRRSVTIGVPSKREQPQLINRALWRPFAVPDEWRQLYIKTQDVTRGGKTDNLLRQCRFYSTFQWADHAAKLPQGDVIECGCWHGHSTIAIATILRDRGFTGRFHVFDSFEGGLSDFETEDDGVFALSAAEKDQLVTAFASSEDFVRSVTSEFRFVDLHKGWIPDVFADFQPGPVRFVHIDVDMYGPTKATLELFWDTLVSGGVMVCDDYNYSIFEGANRAVDEFLADKQPTLVYKVPFGSIAIVK
jgi:O-methyltransferase